MTSKSEVQATIGWWCSYCKTSQATDVPDEFEVGYTIKCDNCKCVFHIVGIESSKEEGPTALLVKRKIPDVPGRKLSFKSYNGL